MRSINEIPDGIKRILDTFNFYKYIPLTLQNLSNYLNEDEGTINQRILRSKNKYFIGKGKPKIITVRGVKPVVCYRYMNKCNSCRKDFDDENLTIKKFDLHDEYENHIENLYPVCNSCLKKSIKEIDTIPIKVGANRTFSYKGRKWEYKQILIKRENSFNPNRNPEHLDYYSFIEVNDEIFVPDDNWCHLSFINKNKQEKKVSTGIMEILNYFGEDGWEIISIENKQYLINNEIQAYTSITPSENYTNVRFKREKI